MKTYKARLIVKTPTFVGSGKQYTRLDYIKQNNVINVIDEEKFFKMLVTQRLDDEYERFVMKGKPSLTKFYNEHTMHKRLFDGCVKYKIGTNGLEPSNIACFIRNSEDRPYIPGSSIKGAIRTAVLTEMIKDNLFDSFGETEKEKEECINRCNNYIMNGISISDTNSVNSNNLMLCDKNDVVIGGDINRITAACKECLHPGTELSFTITVNEKLTEVKELLEYVKRAIKNSDDFYIKTYVDIFKERNNLSNNIFPIKTDYIILGGGSGFFAKNLLYPMYGSEAVRKTAELLIADFKGHHHEDDVALGISPHCLKCTQTADSIVHFGICSIQIGDEICI